MVANRFRTLSVRIALLVGFAGLILIVFAWANFPAEASPVRQATATFTKTPTRTNTPTATPIHHDWAEPNNNFAEATALSVGASPLGSLTFYPNGDVDVFTFYGKAGRTYQATSIVPDSGGVDTYMRVFSPDEQLLGENDDAGTGNLGSRVVFFAATTGYYYVELTTPDYLTDPVGKLYQIKVEEVAGTPSVTPTPTRTPTSVITVEPIEGADPFEPNYDFEHATILAAGVQYDNLNFVPWAGSDPNQPDNDFFRVWVKPGLMYSCETLNLTPGTDTNMIFYFGPSFDQGGPGNDDRTPADFSSQVDWFSTYTGWLYVLVGPRWAGIPPAQLSPFRYSIKCTAGLVPTATPVPTNTPWPTSSAPQPTYTPRPTYTQYPSSTPEPSNTPDSGPVISPTPTSTFTPAPQPIPLNILPLPTVTPAGSLVQIMTIDVLIYYDANQNMNPEEEEGVQDLAVAVYDTISSELVAFGYTNESGALHIGPVTVTGAARLEIPFLGFSRHLSDAMSMLDIRIVPRPLPQNIP